MLLAVRAGGRCEFGGCNVFLFEHPLTLTAGNFSQFAHIVAFNVRGPRGQTGARPSDINSIENLMLLCPVCHKLVDDHPVQYPRELLEQSKSDHEDRIALLTGLAPNARTVVLNFKAPVRGQAVDIPPSDIARALYPRFPHAKRPHLLDLNVLKDTKGSPFYAVAGKKMDQWVTEVYAQGAPAYEIRHVSLFALGPIPALVYLGSRLSNKIPLDLFQRHRDTQDWVWKTDGAPAEFKCVKMQDGTDPLCVALALPLSGEIDLRRLPEAIANTGTVYALRHQRRLPGTDFLRRRDDLESFATAYRAFLAMLGVEHPRLGKLHLFAAVPAPIAVLCGFERLPFVQPHLLVYENDGPDEGFVPAMLVDDHAP